MKDILNNLIFLDTETTGLSEEDRLFQVAYIYQDKEYSELFKTPLPNSIESSEVTHYTNIDVSDKPTFVNSNFEKELKNILINTNNILVAHNAKFDIQMLEKEGLKVNNFIDTHKVAQHLDPHSKLGAYRLQYLRYALELKIPKNIQAHDALSDVIVLLELFKRLFNKMKKQNLSDKEVIEEMIKITQRPMTIKKITFGKYKGKTLQEIIKIDRGYLVWLRDQKEKEKSEGINDNEDWLYTLEQLLD